MSDQFTNDDADLLSELGVETETNASDGRTAREQRIIAGFEEIERFYMDHGRKPEHGEQRDIFERIYAIRLDQIRDSAECREILKNIDNHGLLKAVAGFQVRDSATGPTDDELLADLGVDESPLEDLARLVHVRSRDEIKAAEEVAQRTPCRDFEYFKARFEKVQAQIESGVRQNLKYQDNADVQKGDLFILHGQKIVVADLGEPFVSDYGRKDQRLRVVYDNGTESALLARSLQRALNKDKSSRRITEPALGPLFSGVDDKGDLPTGNIYVLRSKSEHPFVAANRTVIHKIGVTGGEVKKRIANAKMDPTYLLAEVEIVTTFKLANINRKRLEALLHKFFASARLDLELKDRFGGQVEPREWFLVPLSVIEEVIQMLMVGSIDNYRYDRAKAQIVEI